MRINFLNLFIFLITALASTSCSFNNTFLQPTKVNILQPEKKEVTIKTHTENDTTFVSFDTKTYQPIFLDTNKEFISKNYTVKSHLFPAENGNLLNGWLIQSKDITPNITLLQLHGNSGFVLTQYETLLPLLDYGFQIFIVDYSGFGFSEGEATRTNILEDSNAALKYIKNLDDVRNNKLVIYGQSLGGHVAAVVAAQNESLIDGLVIEGAFSSHKDMGAVHAGWFGRLLIKEKYSAYKFIREYKKPLLLIHSIEDDVVPFEMGEKIFKNANEPKDFYRIDKCHLCGPKHYAKEIAQKIQELI